jgi:hypothetical protein
MKLKTKLRFVIILLITAFFVATIIAVYVLSPRIGGIYLEQLQTGYISGFILGCVFVLAIYSRVLYIICSKILLITFQLENRTVIFHYPFLWMKEKYKFDDIQGFCFSTVYPSNICRNKALVFKTFDNRKYSITDFEIGNLRAIESFALENFQLKAEPKFSTLNNTQRLAELEKNKQFDISQAKEYRSSCFLALGILALLTWVFTEIAPIEFRFIWMVCTVGIISLIILIYNIVRANKRINELRK